MGTDGIEREGWSYPRATAMSAPPDVVDTVAMGTAEPGSNSRAELLHEHRYRPVGVCVGAA